MCYHPVPVDGGGGDSCMPVDELSKVKDPSFSVKIR